MNCDHAETRVLETRRFEGRVYRVRECQHCGQHLATVELPTPDGKLPRGLQGGRRKKSYLAPSWAALGFPLRRDVIRTKGATK